MRILVGWEDPAQLDLLRMYLAADGNEVTVATDPDGVRAELAGSTAFDVTLLSTELGGPDAALELFHLCRRLRPANPVVCGCPHDGLYHLARFLAEGAKGYVFRDPQGDYLFLVLTVLEAAVAAAQAEREQKVAEKLREEVESVRRVQETLIPQGVKTPAGYQVAARYEPSQVRVVGGQPVSMAGGDYYDLFGPQADRFVVLVGDASGHGMKACMAVVAMHTLVRMMAGGHALETAGFIDTVNKSVCPQQVVTADGGFITMLYGVLDADTNVFRWCSAGHPPPLLHRLDTGEVTEAAADDAGGMPLGLFDAADYDECCLTVPPRSRVLVYTDGLADAFADGEGEHQSFGVPGIADALRASAHLPLEEAVKHLFRVSHEFTGGCGRHDDTTVVLLERTD